MIDGEQHNATVVDQTRLNQAVRHRLGDTTATVVEWRQQLLQDGFSGFAIERLQGHAQTATGNHPWSLIRKVIAPRGGSQTPEAWDYWQREVLVYQSDLLADLPDGLAAPRCYAIDEVNADEYWLWLEDIGTVDGSTWPLARYGLAARHFGRWNGIYLRHAIVVGFISLLGNEVGGLFVDPPLQSSGIGRALIDHARLLHGDLEVEVFKANHIGRRFYARCSFAFVNEHVDAQTGQPVLRLRYRGLLC